MAKKTYFRLSPHHECHHCGWKPLEGQLGVLKDGRYVCPECGSETHWTFPSTPKPTCPSCGWIAPPGHWFFPVNGEFRCPECNGQLDIPIDLPQDDSCKAAWKLNPQHKTLKEIYGVNLQILSAIEHIGKLLWLAAGAVFCIWIATQTMKCTGG